MSRSPVLHSLYYIEKAVKNRRETAQGKKGGGDRQQALGENELTAPPARSTLESYSWEFLTPLLCHTAHKNRKQRHPVKEEGKWGFFLRAVCRNADVTVTETLPMGNDISVI